MNIIDFLENVANNLPNGNIYYEKIKIQPAIRSAIEMNNSEMLKLLISDKLFYANQTLVTLY